MRASKQIFAKILNNVESISKCKISEAFCGGLWIYINASSLVRESVLHKQVVVLLRILAKFEAVKGFYIEGQSLTNFVDCYEFIGSMGTGRVSGADFK